MCVRVCMFVRMRMQVWRSCCRIEQTAREDQDTSLYLVKIQPTADFFNDPMFSPEEGTAYSDVLRAVG